MTSGLGVTAVWLALWIPAATQGQTAGGESKRAAAADEAIRRAAAWLWAEQADDGGWHSRHYGLLRSGQALTPFVLDALLRVPAELAPRPAGGVPRALDFIRRHTNDRGALGFADPDVLEYPNYATAHALRCLAAAGRPDDAPLVARMRDYLAAEQFGEARGWSSDAAVYGGWGFGGRLAPGQVGHLDLAHTRHAAQALRDAKLDAPHTWSRLEIFLRMLQRHPADQRPQPPAGARSAPFDGGFYFSPTALAANKGRSAGKGSDEYFRSYATATCDGILALRAAGVPDNDPRIVAAARWLADHPALDYPAGVPRDHPEPWGAAIEFYHLAVRAEVYRELGWPGPWREELRALIVARQQPDGRLVNHASPLMKEDDPLIATTLALGALVNSGIIR